MRYSGIDDTIAAVATAAGYAGIGLVRMSGKEALRIAESVFVPKDAGKLSSYKGYTLHYGWIIEKAKGKSKKEKEGSVQEAVDEVLLSVMRAPRSYTREDVVEISCHGGDMAVRRILEVLLDKGARLAEPGEFTKRAFLNGRIDLTQAEAVADLINAHTRYALRVSLRQLKGHLAAELEALRELIVGLLARLETAIDFVSEEIDEQERAVWLPEIAALGNRIDTLLEEGMFGARLRDGFSAAICGRANVGKSSLLNALLRQERSIVTHLPGTTRDTVEETVVIRGVPVRLIDTAGLLRPRDLIDRKALARMRRSIDQADVVVLVFDGSRRLTPEDETFIRRLKGRRVIPVINKCDLRQRIRKELIEAALGAPLVVSAKQGSSLNLLEDAFMDLVYSGKAVGLESAIALNERQRGLMRSCRAGVTGAYDSLVKGLPAEFVSCDLKEALGSVERLLGRRYDTELLDEIFSRFCIGK